MSPQSTHSRVRTALAGASISVLALLAAPAAHATPAAYTTGLANPATQIDFSNQSEGAVVGTLYAPLGVTFGGLYITSALGNTLPPTTAPAAANFQGNTTNAVFTIVFSTAVTDAEFFLYTDGYGTTITSSLAGNQVEQTAAGSYHNDGADFFGFTGSRFDTLTVAVAGTGNAVIDNVQFGTAATPVPEPAAAGLLLVGLAGMLAVRRRA